MIIEELEVLYNAVTHIPTIYTPISVQATHTPPSPGCCPMEKYDQKVKDTFEEEWKKC